MICIFLFTAKYKCVPKLKYFQKYSYTLRTKISIRYKDNLKGKKDISNCVSCVNNDSFKIKKAIVIIFICKVAKKQETLRTLESKLPLAHLFTTHGGGFTLSLLMLNVKQGSCEYLLYSLWLEPTGNPIPAYSFRSRWFTHLVCNWLNSKKMAIKINVEIGVLNSIVGKKMHD